ncbi:MAG: FecR/PupR family sigma factor regulator, partial [Pseudomonadota bacterium]
MMDTLAKNHAERIKAEAVEWRLLVLDGKLGPEEQRAFDAWLAGDPRHQTAYQHAAEIWEAFGAISRDNLSPELFIPQSQTLLPRLPSFIRSLGFEKPQFVFMTLVAALVTTAVAFLASNGERQHVQPASAVV